MSAALTDRSRAAVRLCVGQTPVPTTVDMPGMPNPEAALQQSIHHVDAEMAELDGQLTPSTTEVDQPVIPEDHVARRRTFAWNGPLDAGVAKLAASIELHVLHDRACFAAAFAQRGDPDLVRSRLPGVPGAWRGGRGAGDGAGLDPLHAPGPGDPPCM